MTFCKTTKRSPWHNFNANYQRTQKDREQSTEFFHQTKAWLELTFPKAFDFAHPIPLKKGIRQELLAKDSPFSKIQVNNGLKSYVRSYAYLKAIIRYQWRHDLNGQQVEEILEEEKKYSKQLLFLRKEMKYGKKTQSNSEGEAVRNSQDDRRRDIKPQQKSQGDG